MFAFANRHKKKAFVTVGIAAAGYYLVDYVKNKFFELQDRLAAERTARENLKRRFEQNQEDASFTIMALLPGLAVRILEKYPVEQITEELKSKRVDRTKLDKSATSLEGSGLISEAGDKPSEQGDGATGTQQNNENEANGTEDKAAVVAAPEGKSKTELWREIKIYSLTRAITLIYCSALLIFFTRLQLNILGRKNYVASVIHMAEQQRRLKKSHETDSAESSGLLDSSTSGLAASASDIERIALEEEELRVNKMYLTFSWWLLNRGWMSLSERVEAAVSDVFDQVNPRTELTVAELSALIGQVQFRLDHPLVDSTEIPSLQDLVNANSASTMDSMYNAMKSSQINAFKQNLLPPTELETYVLAQAPQDDGDMSIGPALRKLLDETTDLIESPNAIDVIHRLVHAGLSVFVDKVFSIYPPEAGSVVRLANILANVTKQGQAMSGGKPYEPNDYILTMTGVAELDGFSALVYSNYDSSSVQ